MQHNLQGSDFMNERMGRFADSLKLDGKSKNTIKSYILHIEKYFQWYNQSFGEDPEKLFRQNVLEYKSYLLNIKNLSAKSVNAKLSALIRYNKLLVKNHIQDNIVISKSDFLKIQHSVASPCKVNKKQVEEFRQKVLENEGSRNFAIVTIMAYAGLRISEVLNLKMDDVDLIGKEIKIINSKENKSRIVFINDKIIEAVREYLKVRNKDSKYLFLSRCNRRINRTVINKMFKKYSDIMTPHMLRHFFCSNALEAGYSIHEVANQAGHSNVNTTLLYTNPSINKMKEKANLL